MLNDTTVEICPPPVAFTKEEEERKREEYLKKNLPLKLSMISAAITFAERNLPPHLRRNRPRAPHQRFDASDAN